MLAISTEVLASSETQIEINKRQIRQFVLFNYRPLSLDIISKKGLYLDSLQKLIAPSCQVDEVKIQDLLVPLTQIRYIPDFARAVANQYENVEKQCTNK